MNTLHANPPEGVLFAGLITNQDKLLRNGSGFDFADIFFLANLKGETRDGDTKISSSRICQRAQRTQRQSRGLIRLAKGGDGAWSGFGMSQKEQQRSIKKKGGNTMKTFLRVMICTLLSFIISTPVIFAAGPGNGGSGGSGNGGGMENPDYGDIVVIERDKSGVPIYDGNGCLQPLDINGDPIPLDTECEVEVGYEDAVLEVEFGRLNLARSPEKVRQQALDEAIQAIKDCLKVTLDPAGRLALKYRIMNPYTGEKEVVWKTIDSARENLALYTQLMKFGHLQTACNEIASDRGDEPTYRPCLDIGVDYPKFKSTVKYLLPGTKGSTTAEPLTNKDLTLASFFLAGAADKGGTITVDLVQYLNTILDIPNENNALSNPDFVDFKGFLYNRSNKFEGEISVLQYFNDMWQETTVPILDWLNYQDEGVIEADRWGNIKGFVQAANDSLQTILFLHNYSIPVPLWTYDVAGLSGAIIVNE